MWRINFVSFIVIGVVFALMNLRSWGFRELATYFPVTITLLGVLIAFVAAIKVWRRERPAAEQSALPDSGELGQARTAEEIASAGIYVLWLSSYVVLVIVIGLVAASPIFVALFLKRYADIGWMWSIAGAAGVSGLLFAFHSFLDVTFPSGVLL